MSARDKQLFATIVATATLVFLISITPFAPEDSWKLIIAPIGACLVIVIGFLFSPKKR